MRERAIFSSRDTELLFNFSVYFVCVHVDYWSLWIATVRMAANDVGARDTRPAWAALALAMALAEVVFRWSWTTLLCVSLTLSLPIWFPVAVLKMRFWAFTKINGGAEGGIELPSDRYGVSVFKKLYSHPLANIRMDQKVLGLSDFFWYLLQPSSAVHQEHIESAAPAYKWVSQATKLLVFKRTSEALRRQARDHLARRIGGLQRQQYRGVILRDFWLPMFVEMNYELAFDERPSKHDLSALVAAASDVITALKFNKLRDMRVREAAVGILAEKISKIRAGGRSASTVPEWLRALDGMDDRDAALYVQGVVIVTGSVQLSEALMHLCLSLSHHPKVQQKLHSESVNASRGGRDVKLTGRGEAGVTAGQDSASVSATSGYLDAVIKECYRLYPLFGIAHRITSGAIDLGKGLSFPKGSVFCFNYPRFHQRGYNHPTRFDPSRWARVRRSGRCYIPFGMPKNRPCPGQRISEVWVRELLFRLSLDVQFESSAPHSRSQPDGGPVLLIARSNPPVAVVRLAQLAWMWLLGRVRDVTRSAVQLVCGVIMLLDTKRRAPALHFFKSGQNRSRWGFKDCKIPGDERLNKPGDGATNS